MTVFITLDDKNGMLFNNRRQSKDKFLRNDMLNTCGEKRLWMNEYTSEQFEPLSNNIIIDEMFLEKAKENDYCFVENCSFIEYVDKVKRIIIYKWNRVYPADMYFDLSILEGWKQLSTTEFEGNSHEKIIKEEWIYEN